MEQSTFSIKKYFNIEITIILSVEAFSFLFNLKVTLKTPNPSQKNKQDAVCQLLNIKKVTYLHFNNVYQNIRVVHLKNNSF
ncbi:MAG: hypothetical protein U9P82_11840 [Bacteroidota bacterium]|nr:hypothetical protein [Bacteroidota bacterium]